MKKRLLSTLMVLAMLISLVAVVNPVAAAETYTPQYSVSNYTFTLHNATGLNYIRYAPDPDGVLTTTGAIKNAEGMVAVRPTYIDANMTAGGELSFEVVSGGTYSFWFRFDNGVETILTAVEINNFLPEIVAKDGPKLTIGNLYGVKDFFLVRGHVTSYNEIKNGTGRIVRYTNTTIGTRKTITYGIPTHALDENNEYTLYVRYEDTSKADYYTYFSLDLPEPELTVNGLRIWVTGLEGLKTIRTAPGHLTTTNAIKNAVGMRNFSAKSFLSGGRTEMGIQYRTDGEYSLACVYSNGYEEIFNFTIHHLEPTVSVNDTTVTLTSLTDLQVIRYALGTYTNAGEIKDAPGAKFIRGTAVENDTVTLTLAPGTYTFLVQYTEESQNIFTLTLSEPDPEYTLTFDANGGTIDGSATVSYAIRNGQTYASATGWSSIHEPVRSGYNFLGWYCNGSRLTNLNLTYSLEADSTFTASWEEIIPEYTLTFDANGGTIDGKSSINFKIKTGETYASATGWTSIHEPVRSGYTFLGWYYQTYKLERLSDYFTLTTDGAFTAKWEVEVVPKQSIALNGQTLLEEKELASGVTLSHVKTASSSVYGLQNMNIVEFDPAQNDLYFNVVPAGQYANTRNSVTTIINRYNNNNPDLTPIMAVNGDLWMMSSAHARIQGSNTSYGGYNDAVVTGALTLPRGFSVYNGEIYCSSHIYQETPYEGEFWSMGITATGEVVIGCPMLDITAKSGTKTIAVDGLNRLPANNALVLYTDKGCASNKALDDAYELLINVGYDYTVKHGAKITGTVAGIYNSSTSANPTISSTTMILTARGTAVSKISSLAVGASVTFDFTVSERYDRDSAKWQTVTDAVGGHMPFVVDGVKMVTGTTTGYPSTIVGIKNDGNMIIIADDGRQSSLSRGLDFNDYGTLADELNINTGIILDGGGSTEMVVLDNNQYKIVNSPSDGSERVIINSVMLSVGPSRTRTATTPVVGYAPSSFTSLDFRNNDDFYMIFPNIETKVTKTAEGAKIMADRFNGSGVVNICFGFPGSAVQSSYLTVPSNSPKINITTYPYAVMDMKVYSRNASIVQFQSIYLNSGTRWQSALDDFYGFNNAYSNDNTFHKYLINMPSSSNAANLKGQLNTITIGYLMPLNGLTIYDGDYVVLRGLRFFKTLAEAQAYANT